MKLKKIKEEIQEAKQVGTVYHFTKLENLHKMLHQSEPFKLESHNGETISTTRNPSLNKHNRQFAKHGVRITLDGDKISENHKIKPLAGLIDNEDNVFHHFHNPYRVKRSSGEHEEAILKHPFNIKPYIKHVHIMYHRDTADNVEKHIIPKLKEMNIPYTHHKSLEVSESEYNPPFINYEIII